jgi:hypothetical protein
VSFAAIILCVDSQRVFTVILLSTQSGNFWINPRITKKKVKPAEILRRLRTQFGDETLSGTQLYVWITLYKEDRTEVENVKTTQFAGKVMASVLGRSRRLINRLSDRKTKHERGLLFEAS